MCMTGGQHKFPGSKKSSIRSSRGLCPFAPLLVRLTLLGIEYISLPSTFGCRGHRLAVHNKVTLVVADLGWVDYDFAHSTVCPVLLGQKGILAESAGQLGKMFGHPNQSQPNPSPRPLESPYRCCIRHHPSSHLGVDGCRRTDREYLSQSLDLGGWAWVCPGGNILAKIIDRRRWTQVPKLNYFVKI